MADVKASLPHVSRVVYHCLDCNEIFEDGGVGERDREKMRVRAKRHVAKTGHAVQFVVERVVIYRLTF